MCFVFSGILKRKCLSAIACYQVNSLVIAHDLDQSHLIIRQITSTMYNPPRRFSHQSNETINIGVSERRKITTKPKHIIPSAIGDKIQILKPISVAVSPHDGKMVIADQELGQLIFFDKKYKFVKTVGKPGHDEGEYHLIKAVSIGVNGDIVVADSGNNRIQVLSPGGDFVRAFGSGGKNVGQFDDITDIVVDSQNRIYVCDAGNSRVQILDLSGSFIREFGSCGSKIGDIVHPQSIAVCPSTGNVILADTGNRRVQVSIHDSTRTIPYSLYGVYISISRNLFIHSFINFINLDMSRA